MAVTTFLDLLLFVYLLTCLSRMSGKKYFLSTEVYLGPYQTSMMESFGENSQQLKAINIVCRKADMVQNTPLT